MKKILFSIALTHVLVLYPLPLYFCTAADHGYFYQLINLIGSIQKHNFNELVEIAVFDLGMLPDELHYLKNIQKISVHTVELTHPNLLRPVRTQPLHISGMLSMHNYEMQNPGFLQNFIRRTWHKYVPGWYAWKPVIIKQALDMFPYMLYIDAGTTVYGPLQDLFLYITEHNYFFHNGSPWCIKQEATHHVITTFNLEAPQNAWILDLHTQGLEAGLMGLTRAMLQDFVLPMYELTKDLVHFEDDGTAHGKFGNSRHDLTLFSIIALQHNYTIHHHFKNPSEPCFLKTSKGIIPFHIACNKSDVQPYTIIYCSRKDIPELRDHIGYIRFK